VVARELEGAGIACQSELLSYVNLRHVERTIAGCREFHPDILVLQLGNYEFGNELGRYLLTRMGFKPKKRSSSSMTGVQIADRPRYSLRAAVKQWIDRCLGHPLVDFPTVSERLQSFLAATASCAGQVILTSPTPCADATARYYRLSALPIVEAAATRYHCAYVDLMAIGCAAEQQTLGRDMFFADAIHLGIAGQTAVGRCLAAHIRKVVENAAIKH
jgi:hypothetical protein